MMNSKTYKWIIASLIILSLVSCGHATVVPTTDPALLETIVAQNVQLTMAAAALTSISETQSAPVIATATPEIKETATPEATATTKLEGIWLTFSVNTNCRLGPSTYYYLINTFDAAEKAQAIAQSPDGLYIYVRYMDSATHYCWVPKESAVVTGGDTAGLQEYTAIPTTTPTITPTPAAGFTVTYNSLTSCSSAYAVRVLVKNTGYLTWQSMKIVFTDTTKGTTVTETSDEFVTYDGCKVTTTQNDLANGEFAIVSNFNNPFSYTPAGHKITIVVSLYSENGLSGTVITQTVSATP